MKTIKFLLCAGMLAAIALLSSCNKNTTDVTSQSVDVSLSFTTTEDLASITIRQYEILVDGSTVLSGTISGASFSKTENLLGLSGSKSIDIKVTASLFSGTELPATLKVQNSYKVTCKNSKGFATNELTASAYTISRDQLSEFLSDELNYTYKFKLNEDGSISKLN